MKLGTLITVGLAGVILGVWIQSNLRPMASVADAPAAPQIVPVLVANTRLIEPTSRAAMVIHIGWKRRFVAMHPLERSTSRSDYATGQQENESNDPAR